MTSKRSWILAALTLFALSCATAQSRREVPDIAIKNATILDVANKTLVLNQEVLIDKGVIVHVIPQPARPTLAKLNLDGANRILLPGFVDTHTHLWQHIGKSAAPDKKLQEWATAVYRGSRYMTPAEVKVVTRAAAAEALSSGITTVIDFASVNVATGNLAATVEALREKGVDGAVIYWHEAAFSTTADREREIAALQNLAPNRIEIWMGYGPLSFFDVPAVYDGIALAARKNLRITEHTMENLQEERSLQERVTKYLAAYTPPRPDDRTLLEKIRDTPKLSLSDAYLRVLRLAETTAYTDRELLSDEELITLVELPKLRPPSPVPFLAHIGGLDKRFVSIHSVWQGADDLETYKDKKVVVSYNPDSNMYLSSGVAPLRAWRANNLTVTLGTDGAASNDGISMFSAMRSAINLQKVETLNIDAMKDVTPWELLAMATTNGAEALGWEKRIGKIEKGYEADVVLLDLDRLGMSPSTPADPARIAALIVNSATPRDVHTVISNGIPRVRNGALVDAESADARALSQITRELVGRVTNGVQWKETGPVPETPLFRVVHNADDIELVYRNTTSEPLRIRLRFSGTLFGGTVPAALDAESLKRFPLNPPAAYREYIYLLPARAGVILTKKPRSTEWTIVSPEGTIQRTGVGAEQIYVAAVR